MIAIKQPGLLLLFCTSLLVSFKSLGQFKNYNTENERWFPGTVRTMENETLEGELNYNFVSQALRLRQPGQIETLNAEQVIYFELEQENNAPKVFYSLPYKDEAFDRERSVFFSVIHEGKGIALLSRYLFEFKDNHWLLDPSNSTSTQTTDLQPVVTDLKIEKIMEVVYIANASGSIRPYLEGKKSKNFSLYNLNYQERLIEAAEEDEHPGKRELKYNEKKFKESKTAKEVKNFKIIDKNALSESTGAEFRRLESFIERNNIQLNTIEGLIEVVDHYSKIKGR